MKKLLFTSALMLLAACQSTQPVSQPEPPRRQFTDEENKEYAFMQFNVYDPIEPTNKQIYKFNAKLDEYVLIPAVDAYKYVTPKFVRNRVTNFFANIGEFSNFTNAVLQVKLGKASKTLGRFVVNTTVGVAGTFDVATDWGLIRQPEDFGKTLGYYGVEPGAYLVVPVLGPSNIRDTAGNIVDFVTFALVVPDKVSDTTAYKVVAYGLEPLDTRASNDFRYFESGSPFEYELVRYITSEGRQLAVLKEKAPDKEKPATEVIRAGY